jgi:hypothetical protein
MIHVEAQGQEDPKEPWLDMVFEMVDCRVEAEEVAFTCAAQSDLGELGFSGRVPRYWPSFIDASGEVAEPLVFKPVRLMADAERSAALARYVSGWPVSASEDASDMPPWDHPPSVLVFACVHLGGEGDIDLAKDYARLKLFHERDPYWESFFHFVPEAGQIAMNEKDPSYRKHQRDTLVRAWG